MNSSTLLLGSVCGILAVALVWQNRSAATAQETTVGELGKFSNDWKQATFKLDEQSRLAYTLQTQLKRIQAEHLTVTNELPKLKASMLTLESNHVALADLSRSVSNRLHLEVLELKDERSDFQQRLLQLQTILGSKENEIQNVTRLASNAVAEATVAANAWKRAEGDKARLEAQFRDPVILSALLARSQEATKTKPRTEIQPGTAATGRSRFTDSCGGNRTVRPPP